MDTLDTVHLPIGPTALSASGLLGPDSEIIANFTWPGLGRPHFPPPAPSDPPTVLPSAVRVPGPETDPTAVRRALEGRIALWDNGDPYRIVPALLADPLADGDGWVIPLLASVEERRLYDVAIRGAHNWVTVAPHAIYYRSVWDTFGIAHISDLHVARRIDGFAKRHTGVKFLARLSTVPAMVADGTRAALHLVSHPSRAGLAVVGAVGFWAANIGILWASFKAFGIAIPLGVVVMGFFIGMVANLLPFVPAGVGAVDAGMIGTFVLFGFPEEQVFAAVLIYRLVAFWLPIPPGVAAFFQLRNTVKRWKREELPVDRPPRPGLIEEIL